MVVSLLSLYFYQKRDWDKLDKWTLQSVFQTNVYSRFQVKKKKQSTSFSHRQLEHWLYCSDPELPIYENSYQCRAVYEHVQWADVILLGKFNKHCKWSVGLLSYEEHSFHSRVGTLIMFNINIWHHNSRYSTWKKIMICNQQLCKKLLKVVMLKLRCWFDSMVIFLLSVMFIAKGVIQ